MTTSKIEFALGALTFSGEGSETWLSQQLDKIIQAAPTLGQIKVASAPADNGKAEDGGEAAAEDFQESLAAHIKAKGGDQKQVVRFLATADWLRRRGANHLTTALVAKALKDNHQARLGNPADCLGQNIQKGLCEKKNDGFFITPSGLKELGYS